MSEPTKIKVFYQSGDTPFIVWAHGPISSNMLASIESDIEKDPPSEFEDYGNGTYCYDVEWDSGQYDEYGRCEFPSGWELMFTAFEKMNPEAAQPAPKEDAELEQLLRERDDLEAVINRILDLVLGSDRHEWSSAYEYTDALLDVEERMAALDMVPDARTCGSSDGSLRNPCPQHGEAKRCRYCKRAEGQGCGDEAMAQNTGAEPRCMREPEAKAGADDASLLAWLACGGWEVMQDPRMWPEELNFRQAIAAGKKMSEQQGHAHPTPADASTDIHSCSPFCTCPAAMKDKPAEGGAVDRDTGGRIVREAWVRWALTQPNPKPSWLIPYDELSEPDKEADRQIFEACRAAPAGSGGAVAIPVGEVQAPSNAPATAWLYEPRNLPHGTKLYAGATPAAEDTEIANRVRSLPAPQFVAHAALGVIAAAHEPATGEVALPRRRKLGERDDGRGVYGYRRKDVIAYGDARAAAAASRPATAVPENVRKLVGRIDMYRLRMSYNDSYFGEPSGLLKGVFAELARAVNPIYPSGKTALYAAPQPATVKESLTTTVDSREAAAKCTQHRPGAPCPWPASCESNGCSAVERELFPDGPTHAAVVADVFMSRYTIEWNGVVLPIGTKLYAEASSAFAEALAQIAEEMQAAAERATADGHAAVGAYIARWADKLRRLSGAEGV